MSAKTVEEYIAGLPVERQSAVNQIRTVLKVNLPPGFAETISYGAIGFVVPFATFPDGYHCKPEEPLPFINIVSQKNYISFHHMGLYGNQKLLEWFQAEYPKHSKRKLDMGKGCVRFKDLDEIPYQLIGELARKVTVQDWIECYQHALTRKTR